MNAIKLYRIMRKLYEWHIPLLPKCLQALIFLVYNSKITPDSIIGRGTYFVCNGISTVLIPGTVIGDNCVLGLRFSTVRQFPYAEEPRIGNNVWIGPNVIVAGPVIVEDDAVIVGGAYVTKSVPKGAIVAGSPAKIVGWRKDLRYDINTNPKYEEGSMPFLRERTLTHAIKSPSASSGVAGEVLQIVAGCLGVDSATLSGNERIDEIEAWDSLTNVAVVNAIEKHFGIKIPQEKLISLISIDSFATTVNECLIHKQEPNGKMKQEARAYVEGVNVEVLQHSPLLQKIVANAKKSPSKLAIIYEEQRISYAELIMRAGQCATVLNDRGLHSGEVIALAGQKEPEFVYMYLAAHILGVCTVIVDSKSNQERLDFIERETKPRLCVGYMSRQIPSILFSDLRLDEVFGYSIVRTDCEPDDISEILFTTGTTGEPKGVCLSYENINGSASNINSYIGNDSTDVEIIGKPICHSFGLGRVRCNLLLGATTVFINGFTNISKFFELIQKHKVSGFGVVPAAWAYIRQMSGKAMSQFAEQIKYIEIGSASMSLATKKEMLEMFPSSRICMHFGSTEASRSCFMEFHDEEHLESIGKAVSQAVDVKIMTAEGKEACLGEKGEICVKGNMVFSRYLREADMFGAFYHGGYFRTGDLGFKSEDGYLYLLGREKELINVGGKKVSPIEVEDIICSLGVGDCVCVPMRDESGLLGEVVKCYVLSNSTSMTFEEISNKLKGRLEAYKCPAQYEWIDEIPKTASGKKQRLSIVTL